MNTKVSVIIPTYNFADYLPIAIESVLNQSYKNFEIILVDDGSTDNTQEVVSRYRDHITYIFQKNAGVSRARNTGIQHAKGAYIAFLDADDQWLPSKLELQMKCFEMLPEVSLIFSNFSAKRGEEILQESYFSNAFPLFKEYKITLHDIFSKSGVIPSDSGKGIKVYWGNIFKSLFLGNFILPSTVLIKRDALNSFALFNEKYRVAEETEFFLRFSKHNEMAFLEAPLVVYQLPGRTNLSGSKNTDTLIRNALNSQLRTIKDDPLFYENNKRLVQKAIGNTYSRLSYFYLSESDSKQARTNALASVNFNPLQWKGYALLLLSLFPQKILKLLAHIKRRYSIRLTSACKLAGRQAIDHL